MDGHEREDVVKSRKEFLKVLSDLKASHNPPPPCNNEMPPPPHPDTEFRKQLVLIYHDESIFNTNEGQTWMWAEPDTPVIQPKTQGSGIMVSNFVEHYGGYLHLNEEEFAVVKETNPDIIIVQRFIAEGQIALYLPKFDCELNPIERVWGQAKCYTRQYSNYSLVRLRNIVNPALDSVNTDLIQKYFRKVGDYERAYMEGESAGKEVENAVKVYKSHCRVFFQAN